MILNQAISQYMMRFVWCRCNTALLTTRVGSTSQSSPDSSTVFTKSPSVSCKYCSNSATHTHTHTKVIHSTIKSNVSNVTCYSTITKWGVVPLTPMMTWCSALATTILFYWTSIVSSYSYRIDLISWCRSGAEPGCVLITLSPMSFMYASMDLVAMLLPRNARFSLSEKNQGTYSHEGELHRQCSSHLRVANCIILHLIASVQSLLRRLKKWTEVF